MDFKFLKQALGGFWLISEAGAQHYAELLQVILQNQSIITAGLFDETESPYRANSKGAKTVNGSVLVLPIEGVMMRNDNCGSMGTERMSQMLMNAYKDNSIESIVLKMNTPGGSVEGTENLSNTVKAANKPIVTWAEQMCSAGYWAGSGADEIMIAGETAMVGSIGTMARMRDTRASDKKRGQKEVVMFASRSIHKNRSTLDALDGKPEAFISEFLDPLNNVFEGAVTENRAGKIDLNKEDVMTGKVYVGSNIISSGLADTKGTLSDAIKRSIQLAKTIK